MATLKPNPNHRGDPLFLPDVLRLFGVKVTEYPGWRNRGHGDFGNIWGVIVHHTGGNNTPARYIAEHPDLGLCSQIMLTRTGEAVLCGAGIAYHAGAGSYPGLPANNANSFTIGIEAQSDGNTPWPAAELDAYYRICAAICWYLQLPASRVIGHKEYAGKAQGKWDPGGIDMTDFRAHVQHYIDHPPFEERTIMPNQVSKDDLILQQLGGPAAPNDWGWPQLGGRTVTDTLGAIGEKLGIPGCYDTHTRKEGAR